MHLWPPFFRRDLPVHHALPSLSPTSLLLPLPTMGCSKTPLLLLLSVLPPPSTRPDIASSWFGPAPNTLTEPVWDIIKRDLSRIMSNLKLMVFLNPYHEETGKALHDWGVWGPIFFIVFLGLTLYWSASVKKVFYVFFSNQGTTCLLASVKLNEHTAY